MYRKIFIGWEGGKQSECSVGPFKDQQGISDWIDSLVALTACTEVDVRWLAQKIPSETNYPATMSPKEVLEAQHKLISK